MWQTITNNTRQVAWAAFLLALPVTSFPFFPPAIGGEALVRPLSIYPLIILIPLAVLPRMVKRPIPNTLQSLLPFVLVAAVSSLLSLLRGIEPALGISVNARVLRGMITLVTGCAIYCAIALLPDSVEDLRFSLRWIYTGGFVALFWGTLQAINIIHFNPNWFNFLQRLQDYISIRRLHADRVAGMTYEPHWFADQITLLLLPWLLAAVLSGYTVFRWRWRWLTMEWLLLGWSVFLMPFTYSRAGSLNLVLLILLSMIFIRPRLMQTGTPEFSPADKMTLRLPRLPRRLLEILLISSIVIIPIYLVGTRNMFFARIWSYWTNQEVTLSGYLSHLGFDARLTYNQAALQTYKAFPFLGVGLGNFAFYFEEMLPYRPIAEVPEALYMITPEKGRDRLITSKNFYLRLLAETGITGAVTFLAFLIAISGCALFLWLSSNREAKFWGTASLCGLIAFMLTAFTFDSFVIPNMWVVFGLITAATRVITHSALT